MSQQEDMSAYVQKIAATMVTLETDSYDIFKSIIDRDDNVQGQKNFFFKKAKLMQAELNELHQELDNCNATIAQLSELFKRTLKKDKFAQFSDGIDMIPFEFFLTAKELEKLKE